MSDEANSSAQMVEERRRVASTTRHAFIEACNLMRFMLLIILCLKHEKFAQNYKLLKNMSKNIRFTFRASLLRRWLMFYGLPRRYAPRNDEGAEWCRNMLACFYIRGEQVKPRRGMTFKANAATKSLHFGMAEPLSHALVQWRRSRVMQKHACMFLYPRRTSQASKRNDV